MFKESNSSSQTLSQGLKISRTMCELLAKKDRMHDTKKELIIILFPNNSTVLITEPASTHNTDNSTVLITRSFSQNRTETELEKSIPRIPTLDLLLFY